MFLPASAHACLPAQVKFSNVSLFVYANNDIVSNELLGKGHSWGGLQQLVSTCFSFSWGFALLGFLLPSCC
jgi:hypothetical protein